MNEEAVQRELHRLKAAIERLDRRVARLESTGVHEEKTDELAEAAPPTSPRDRAYHEYFTRLAVVCFVLVGALVLRIATHQAWLAPLPGTSLGLVYCAALLGAPRLLRRVKLVSRHAQVLQYCGVGLAPLIVLESVHRLQALGTLPATAILFGVGLAGALLGALEGRRGLSTSSLVFQLAAIAGLGLIPEGSCWRAAALGGLAAMALGLAHFKSWPSLRPLVLVPVEIVLGAAVLLTARRPEVPSDAALALLLCALGVWVLVAANHALRIDRLAAGESAWLPVTTVWAYGLAFFHSPGTAAPAGVGLAAVLMALAAWLGWRRTPWVRSLIGMATSGGLLAALVLFPLDPSGLGLAAAALGMFAAGHATRSNFLAVLSQLLAVGALVAVLARGELLVMPATDLGHRLLLGSGLGLALYCHYLAAASRRGPEAGRLLAWVSLVCGTVVVFCVLRLCAFELLGSGSSFQLSQTMLIAGFSILSLAMGKWLNGKVFSTLGLVCLALLAARVVFRDMFSLQGPHLVGSVASLGTASVICSLVLRKRTSRTNS